jgi:hypothetical protein
MFGWLRRTLQQSSHVHLREENVSSPRDVVQLIDRFIDGKVRYPLEWDDFISWEHSSVGIEAVRQRIAALEPLFFSEHADDREEALLRLVAERNQLAAIVGLPARR